MNGRTGSAYAIAHSVLSSAQRRTGRPLNIRQVQECLESTPGLVFSRGTTMSSILGNLERWQLVKLDGEFVDVISSEGG
jgi:hypothetical protein